MSTLSTYACTPEASRGRLYPEAESNTRSCFQRDRDRIIHSTAFRRLEYKTQVFVNHEGDHYRTRLTHSLEVSQMARSVCRSLGLSEDLAETLALAHDLGHTPFGHAGEDALSEAMAPFGGFDHNGHTLRIITSLEQRYAEFDGLNLTWETLEGIAKHNGPLVSDVPRAIAEYNEKHGLELSSYASAEAQIAALSDDIAYNNHDIDDGLRAGLFSIADLEEVPQVAALFHEVKQRYPKIAQPRLIHESIRRIINRMVTDLIDTSRANIAASGVKTVEDIRALGRPVIAFSGAMAEQNRQLKSFLMRRMYRHYKVNRMAAKAKRVVAELFHFFLAQPECLPTAWRALTDVPGSKKTAMAVADFIAGMTDRFALDEHSRIFDVHARSWLGK
ncbi:MAG: deoxyguanosinetriphosphate triphosphohydrolase [Alphaproteobacteria bacterium]|nr:deoxyguanosinetriphosphate triphosphohydrolase [Alphaproteobacteria bacterium]